MVCSLADQRLYLFEGDQLVNVLRCSTGVRDSTPRGRFTILNHHLSHGVIWGGVCDHWMGFTASHGIHAWPRGAQPDCEGALGSPASPGCIVLHPGESQLPYFWAPDGTPLVVTGDSLARICISGCHDAKGVAQPSRDWYFAEGYTAGDFDTYLLLANPGEEAVEACVSFFLEGGGELEYAYPLAPHARFTLPVDGLPELASAAFSVHVHADGPVVAERAVYFKRGSQCGGTVAAGVTQPSRDWYFAEGYTAGDFDTYLLLANPGEEAVEACVSFFLEGGGELEYAYPLAPHARFTLPVDGLPELASAAFSVHVHADGPVVAERAVYFGMGYITGGHAAMGASALSRNWYFAEGCTAGDFDTYLLLGNPGDEDARVEIDYYTPEGSIRGDCLVGAHARATLHLDAVPGLEGKDVSCTVRADRPLVGERAVYYDLDSRRGGHADTGAGAPSREWFFSEGYTDGAFDTFFLLSNPGFTDARVEMRLRCEDGSDFACAYEVPAQRRLTVHVDELPGLARAAFATRIISDVPVVAERAVYFALAR